MADGGHTLQRASERFFNGGSAIDRDGNEHVIRAKLQFSNKGWGVKRNEDEFAGNRQTCDFAEDDVRQPFVATIILAILNRVMIVSRCDSILGNINHEELIETSI